MSNERTMYSPLKHHSFDTKYPSVHNGLKSVLNVNIVLMKGHYRRHVLAMCCRIYSCYISMLGESLYWKPVVMLLFSDLYLYNELHITLLSFIWNKKKGHSHAIAWVTDNDVIKWKHFPLHWPVVIRWIPLTKASEAEFWRFLWSGPQQTVE